MNHAATGSVEKVDEGTPEHGKTIYTATASCNDSVTTLTGETSHIVCNEDENYVPTEDGLSCKLNGLDGGFTTVWNIGSS